ncbi:TPA: hypothetical protein ACKRM8_006313, partial [Pseudomonas aeruginosa]
PNVLLRQDDGLSLHALLGPWFTVLVFADALPPDVRDDALLRWVAVGPLCDARGRDALAHQLGQSMDGSAWLLRPDQHIMAAGGPQALPSATLAAWVADALRPAGADGIDSQPEAAGLPHTNGDARHAAIPATA